MILPLGLPSAGRLAWAVPVTWRSASFHVKERGSSSDRFQAPGGYPHEDLQREAGGEAGRASLVPKLDGFSWEGSGAESART
eukprot:15473663-Alexandrium_andersonii.AAC.1